MGKILTLGLTLDRLGEGLVNSLVLLVGSKLGD